MKLIICRAGLLAIAFLASIGTAIACGIEWSVPSNHFDGVNDWGQLSYWRELGRLDLGDDLKVPLVINFNPTRGNPSVLGRGWFVPILESNIVQVDEKRFLLTQPDGLVRQFWRKSGADSVLKGQSGWMGEIKAHTIAVWAACGWKLVFSEGKLISITTPKKRTLSVFYVNGVPSQLRENATVLLSVEREPSSGQVNGLSFGENHLGVKIGDRPRVDVIQGTNVVGSVQQSLREVKLANGKEVLFEFGVNEKIQPTLNIADAKPRSFTWDPATGRLLKDGQWTYDITLAQDRWRNAAIGRTNEENQSEFWHDNGAKGEEIVQGIDGRRHVKTWFTSGVLSGKIRKISVIKDGKEEDGTSFFYDEHGMLTRKVMSGERVECYTRGKDGRLEYSTTELAGRTIGRTDYDSQERIIGTSSSSNPAQRFYYRTDKGWDQSLGPVWAIVGTRLDSSKVARITATESGRGGQWQYAFLDAAGNTLGRLSDKDQFERSEFSGGLWRDYVDGVLTRTRECSQDGRMREQRTYRKDGNTLEQVQTFEYPEPRTQITYIRDAKNNLLQTITVKTDEKNRIVEYNNSTGTSHRYTYDSKGKRSDQNSTHEGTGTDS